MATDINNSHILEKLKLTNKQDCVEWLMGSASHLKVASKRAYEHTVEKTLKNFQRLNKNKHIKKFQDELKAFLDAPVKYPMPSAHLQKAKQVDIDNGCTDVCKTVNSKLAGEIIVLERNNKKLNVENEQLKRSRSKKSTVLELKTQLRNQVKLSQAKLKIHEKQFKKLNKTLSMRIDVKTKIIKRLRLQKQRLFDTVEKVKNERDLLKTELNECKLKIDEMEKDIINLKSDLDHKNIDLENTIAENDWLADVVEKDTEVLSFYDHNEGKYCYELRECLYNLLSLNVTASSCASVIESVLKLVNKKVDKLPSRSTIVNLNTERLVLSQTQLSEVLPEKTHLTMYTDETTKFGDKFSGYHVSDTDGNMFVLGLRELVSKSGKDTLSALQEILCDIEHRALHSDLTAKKILYNITATMSDRASTEHKFNALLQELRCTVLPELHKNWYELSENNQTAVSELLNFFCGLHSLVHFAEVSNKAILEVQKGFFEDSPPIFDKSFLKSSESGTLRLVRTACKALARGADEKNGKYAEFSIYSKTFLRENGMSCVPLVDFHGNRFNILFESSATLFFLKTVVTDFLEGNQSNNLLKAVSCDIKVLEYVAGCKALGLISRLITGPLWSLLENKAVHIMDMNKHYLDLTTSLVDADIEKVMNGTLEVFGDSTVVNRDRIFAALIEPWQHDPVVEVHLGIILPALGKLCKKLFSDHLPGGKWEHFTEEMRKKSASTQKHNKFAESVFGFLDNLLRKKPNISALASEAYIMYTANKTAQWLACKTDNEKKGLIYKASKCVKTVKQNFQMRKRQIEAKKREAMEEARMRAENLERKRIARLEVYTDRIIYFGLWQSEQSVDDLLNGIPSKSEKKEALKAQLNFRKHVLKQAPQGDDFKDIYLFSKNGKDFSVEELTVKVKKLVHHAFTLPCEPEGNTQQMPILVGRTVKHKFQGEAEDSWWQGKVISQVPGYPSWYNIVYEGDIAVYSYQLLKDWKEGALEIIVT